jgi:L-glyceraldehyde 3-phosphate reductase
MGQWYRPRDMVDLPSRPLGASGIAVSIFALGSWRTFERMPRDQAESVMRRARAEGITFLDDARYDDETGDAPIPSGYSEVVFGELFRAVGWERDGVTVANKLWWEFWPDQSAAEELDGSLGRMGLQHVDLIYACPRPEGLSVRQVVEAAAGLVESGRARAWAVTNWTGEDTAEAVALAREVGAPPPCATQLGYSLVQRGMVEVEPMAAVLDTGEVGLVASYVLAGGTLTGKYLSGGTGRLQAVAGNATMSAGLDGAAALVALAEEWSVSPASLAFAFVLDHPHLASVLFGATTPEQVSENLASRGVHDALSPDQRDRLRSVGRSS